jgi:hypothetical protein
VRSGLHRYIHSQCWAKSFSEATYGILQIYVLQCCRAGNAQGAADTTISVTTTELLQEMHMLVISITAPSVPRSVPLGVWTGLEYSCRTRLALKPSRLLRILYTSMSLPAKCLKLGLDRSLRNLLFKFHFFHVSVPMITYKMHFPSSPTLFIHSANKQLQRRISHSFKANCSLVRMLNTIHALC